MSSIVVDVDLWPIAAIHLRGEASQAELEAFTKEYDEKVFSRDMRYVSITNLSLLGPPGAAERRYLAGWMKKHDAYMRQYAIANTTVASSALVRGAMTALFWLQRPPVKQSTAADLKDAAYWAVDQLREDGRSTSVGDVDAWVERNSVAAA